MKEELLNKFVKVCSNQYSTEKCLEYKETLKGAPIMGRNPELYDLFALATEADKKGKNFFFADPIDPDNPSKGIRKAEARYHYTLKAPLTEEEFNIIARGLKKGSP